MSVQVNRAVGVCFLAGALLAGCGRGRQPTTPIGVSSELELTERAPAPVQRDTVDPDVVMKSARDFSGYRLADDRSFERESFLTHLSAADAICIGEQHDAPGDHFAQWSIIEGLLERRAPRGFELSLGLEMVRTKYQGGLSAFMEGRATLDQFRISTAWDTEWGFPLEFYAPALVAARDKGGSALALGVDRDLTAAVAQEGLQKLPGEQSRRLPQIERGAPSHQELFTALTKGHPHGNADFMYEAQLVWDEAMSEQASSFLRAHAPGRKLVILAGAAHCHRAAIPDRLERRGAFSVVSVLAVQGQPRRATSLGKDAEGLLTAGYDYQLVFSGATGSSSAPSKPAVSSP